MMYSYRVLTPTMYRSRMASARQAVSMDYDDDSGAVKKARLRREGRVVRRFTLVFQINLYSRVSNKPVVCNNHVGYKHTLKLISVRFSTNVWAELFLNWGFIDFPNNPLIENSLNNFYWKDPTYCQFILFRHKTIAFMTTPKNSKLKNENLI